MQIGDLHGFTFHVPTSGGKAGRGCNLTTALQVRNQQNCIIKQFRFHMADEEGRSNAIAKAKKFAQEQSVYNEKNDVEAAKAEAEEAKHRRTCVRLLHTYLANALATLELATRIEAELRAAGTVDEKAISALDSALPELRAYAKYRKDCEAGVLG